MSRSTSRSRSRSRMRAPRRLRALAVMLPALALGACVAGPNFVAPSEHSAIGTSVYTAAPLPHLPTPAQAADTASEVADAALASTPWWLPLASPRLDATIREALQHNRATVKIQLGAQIIATLSSTSTPAPAGRSMAPHSWGRIGCRPSAFIPWVFR